MKYTLSALYVYPIKSFKGISLNKANLSDRGIQFDRRWMLLDEHNKFITQREIPDLVHFDLELSSIGIHLSHPSSDSKQIISFDSTAYNGERIETNIFGNACFGIVVSIEINNWLSAILKRPVKLIFHPNDGMRTVTGHEESLVGFSDSSQYLLLGESALENLNSKLTHSLSIKRFRPNFVFSGGEPHDEDNWSKLKIGESDFEVIKSCGRCQIPTINQSTGEMLAEPMKTLATYRLMGKKILFGRYLKLTSMLPTELKIGDPITNLS